MEKQYLDYGGLSHTIEKIDQIKQDIIQINELPVANEDEFGKIYQFIGDTTADYINGYFYKCISDGAATPIYSWENVSVQAGGEAISYVNVVPVSDIANKVYATRTYTNTNVEVEIDFLDSDSNFIRVGDTYVAASGIKLEASVDDGETYSAFESIEYVSPNYVLTVDGKTSTLTNGDTFYYRVINYKFYAGNEQEQLTIPLANDSGSNSYTAGYGIDITNDEISVSDFVGSREEWEALSITQQAAYDGVYIIDDVSATIENPGHLIISEEDIEMVQRNKLQFAGGVEVTDNSTSDTTKIEVKEYTAGKAIEINDFEITVDDSISPTFTGTQAEWETLTEEEKAEYTIVNITDDIVGGDMVVVDAVENENYNPVTSNAVYKTTQNCIKVASYFASTTYMTFTLTLNNPTENSGMMLIQADGKIYTGTINFLHQGTFTNDGNTINCTYDPSTGIATFSGVAGINDTSLWYH